MAKRDLDLLETAIALAFACQQSRCLAGPWLNGREAAPLIEPAVVGILSSSADIAVVATRDPVGGAGAHEAFDGGFGFGDIGDFDHRGGGPQPFAQEYIPPHTVRVRTSGGAYAWLQPHFAAH